MKQKSPVITLLHIKPTLIWVDNCKPRLALLSSSPQFPFAIRVLNAVNCILDAYRGSQGRSVSLPLEVPVTSIRKDKITAFVSLHHPLSRPKLLPVKGAEMTLNEILAKSTNQG